MPSAAELLRRFIDQAARASEWSVEGLTDDEYFWEPAPDCWTIHRTDDGWRIDDRPQPPKVTTIAWRLVHMASCSAVYQSHTFGDRSMAWNEAPVPGDAMSAAAWLREANARFEAGLRDVTDDDLNELRPTHWGKQLPIWQLGASVAVDLVHHAGEIGVLRDLKRGGVRDEPYPEHHQDGREL